MSWTLIATEDQLLIGLFEVAIIVYSCTIFQLLGSDCLFFELFTFFFFFLIGIS